MTTPTVTDPMVTETDAAGRPVPLDADPTPVRVTAAGPAGQVALTVLRDPTRNHIAELCDLDSGSGSEEPLLTTLAYVALQRARLWRCTVVTTTDHLLAGRLDMSPLANGERWAAAIDRSAHHLYSACPSDGRALVTGRFVDEAVATLGRRARQFSDNAFCRAVREGTLRREQYVAAMANTHQYVRFTPRLLALAIAVADDREVRTHVTQHFRGEQNHDRLVEADLRYLGADVEFVTEAMVPSAATQSFMVVQESGIGYYGDFVRFLAAPFVAEGLSGSLEAEFLDQLEGCIRSWGYDEPTRATRFLRSHVEFDGGDDGHFAQVAVLLTRLLDHDTVQQRFLNTLHLAADAFHRSYDDYAERHAYA